MCCDCCDENGSPKLDTVNVRAAVAAIDELYEIACTGGNLHIVTDDWNIDDDNLDFSDEHIQKEEDLDKRAIEQRCLDLLRSLTVAERASALALRDGLWA